MKELGKQFCKDWCLCFIVSIGTMMTIGAIGNLIEKKESKKQVDNSIKEEA